MKKEIIVYSISDSLGGTSQKLLSAVTAQYPFYQSRRGTLGYLI